MQHIVCALLVWAWHRKIIQECWNISVAIIALVRCFSFSFPLIWLWVIRLRKPRHLMLIHLSTYSTFSGSGRKYVCKILICLEGKCIWSLFSYNLFYTVWWLHVKLSLWKSLILCNISQVMNCITIPNVVLTDSECWLLPGNFEMSI